MQAEQETYHMDCHPNFTIHAIFIFVYYIGLWLPLQGKYNINLDECKVIQFSSCVLIWKTPHLQTCLWTTPIFCFQCRSSLQGRTLPAEEISRYQHTQLKTWILRADFLTELHHLQAWPKTFTHGVIRARSWNNQCVNPEVMLHELHRGRKEEDIK